MKINDLVNKVEPFCFVFDGEELKGEYYKWRTTTPNYRKVARAQIPDELTDGTDEEKAANAKAILEASLKVGEKAFLVDTIKSWDLTDVDGGEVVPPSSEVLEKLPEEFTLGLIAFFDELRNPKENPPTASPVS